MNPRRADIRAAAATGAKPAPRRVASDPSSSKALEVGVARRDVTPPLGQQMWGYLDPEQISDGVRDPLYARALVLKVGDASVGLVVLDFGRMPVPEVCDRIRAKAAEFGLDEVLLMATHTHSGPYMELPDLPHLEPLEAAILELLQEALNKAEPARMGLTRTDIDISHNRRLIKDGVCYMKWRNAERVPTSPIDHEAGVIRFDRVADGKPIAILVNFACHPVIFASDNRKYSADWPGEMSRRVREESGAECFFLQAAAGDINPYLDKTPIAEGGVEAMVSEGAKAAKAVLAALASIKTDVPAAPSIAYREDPVEVGTRWDLSDPGQVKILEDNYGLMYEKYMKGLKPDFAVPLGMLILNGDLALSMMPGEMFVDFQLDLKRRSPLPNTFLCGYANQFHIYFPTVRDIAYGGYGAATVTYVGVGAGEKLVTRSTAMIGEMMGKIRPLSGPEDFQILEL